MLQLDRRTVLATLADGGTPEPILGPDRPAAARRIAGYLRGIRPDDLAGERATAALGGDTPTRYLGYQRHRALTAFTRGVAHLREAYSEYGLTNSDGTDLA